MRKLLWMAMALAAAMVLGTTGWVRSVGAAGVTLDAKEVELTEVLRLLAAQGGPALVADPAIGKSGVSLELAQVAAYEAAWALTSASNASFFIDPWDEGLRKTKVTLKAEKMSLRVAAAELAKQLRAEPVWFDGAYLFARPSQRRLWEDFSVRVYNFEGRGGRDNFALEDAERRAQDRGFPPGPWPPDRPGERGGERSGEPLPYAVNRVGDHALAALPQERHKDVENSLKGGPPGPPRPPFRK